MNKKIELFNALEIETQSRCNRRCEGCLRNSYPDKKAVESWFNVNYLPTEDIERIMKQSLEIGFSGRVCLSHYDESLMDPRIADLGRMAKSLGFSHVYIGSNSDFLTAEMARDLDGAFDEIVFALYVPESHYEKRAKWIQSLFKKTQPRIRRGSHIITHYSPLAYNAYDAIIKTYQNNTCIWPATNSMIINHRGDMMMCCDDMPGHFDLGNIKDHTIEELWYGEKHQDYVMALSKPGGRAIHPHCMCCPRPGNNM